jgi:hypothetical protein
VREDIRDKEPLAYLVVELVATGLLVLSAMAYWSGFVRALLGTSSKWVFVGSLSWILLASYRELRHLQPILSYRPEPILR